MNIEDKIDIWMNDDSFMNFVQQRTVEKVREILEYYPLDPVYEQLDEGFEYDDRYIVPMVDYLVFKLHTAKLRKNSRKRKDGIWWVFVQVFLLDIYVKVFSEEFSRLLPEIRSTLMPILHKEYVQISKKERNNYGNQELRK